LVWQRIFSRRKAGDWLEDGLKMEEDEEEEKDGMKTKKMIG